MATRAGVPADPTGRAPSSGVLDRNIRELLERRAAEERARSFEDRLALSVARFTGRMRFVYIHLVLYGTWILMNSGVLPGVPRPDPTFVILAMAASVEAIFLSTFVLINQNRMAALADRRADLDLHVSLLAEHEVARLIQLTTIIAERLGIAEARDPELEELAQDVRPAAVLTRLEEHTDAVERDTNTRLNEG